MGLFNRSKNVNPDPMPELFSMFNGTSDGKPLVSSVNMAAKNYKSKQHFPWFLGISIEFKSPTEDGLATGDELKKLEQFEDKIQKLIEVTGEARYIAASNWQGHRELVYYTTEPKELAPKLQNMMDSNPEWNFTFSSFHDPKWQSVSFYFK